MVDVVHIIVSYPAQIVSKDRLDALIQDKLKLIAKNSTLTLDGGKRLITSTLTTFDKRTLAVIERGIKALDNGIAIDYHVVSGDWSREVKKRPPDQA